MIMTFFLIPCFEYEVKKIAMLFLSAAYLSSGQAGPQAVGDSEGKAPYYIPGSLGKWETLEFNLLWPGDVI